MDDPSTRGVVIGLIILTFVLAVGICCEVFLRSRWPKVQLQKSARRAKNEEQVASLSARTINLARNGVIRRGPFSRYDPFMWGRIILGAVFVVLVATWLAAIWFLIADPQHWLFTK
jgi:hypothetical protein